MGATLPTLPPVRTDLKRWIEDRMRDQGINKRQLAERCRTSSNKITIIMREPRRATLTEVLGLASALGLHWYDDLVTKWGLGADNITIDDAAKVLAKDGETLGRVTHAA
ncbi:MAG: hypothetical protein AAGA31_08605 [Bacteroidota bacterium]